MTEDEKYIAESNARKKLVGLFALGVLLIIGGLAVPTIFARIHFGSVRSATRLQWRITAGGIFVSCASAYSLYRFRPGYDRK